MAQDYQSSSSRQPRRREETQRSSNTRRRKKRSGLSGAAIYAIFVIGVSALLACIGWVAANDVLALNKPEKTATITITNDDSFGDVAEKLKDEGLIEYKFLFNLFATFTRSKDDVVAGTFTLNTDMDYRALLSGMSANSATRATVTVTIPEGYTVDQIFTLLEEKGVAIDWAVSIEVEDETIVQRMSGRRTCKNCSQTFHIVNNPPKQEGVCDFCGGELTIRKDDAPETVRTRLEVYHRETEPLKDFYAERGKLKTVENQPGIEATTAAIKAALGI